MGVAIYVQHGLEDVGELFCEICWRRGGDVVAQEVLEVLYHADEVLWHVEYGRIEMC